MRTQQLSDALDRCLTLLTEEGATVEECLARYPQHAAELAPLLETAVKIERVPPVAASPGAVAAGKDRMLMALEEKKRRQSMELSHRAESSLLPGLKERITAWLGGDDGRGWQPTPGLRIGLAGAALLALILVGSLLLPSWLGPGVTGMATLELTSGGVEVRAAGDEAWLDALPGQPLEAGARIRTDAESAALLAFFDGSLTVLEEDTELTIVTLRSREDGGATTIILDQRRGRTQHRVVPMPNPGSQFVVRSPEAESVVRGTEFVVVVEEDGTTDVTVREGLVEVRALSVRSEKIELQPGWATSVQPSQPPETAREVQTPPPLEDTPLLKQQLVEERTPIVTPRATVLALATSTPVWTPTPTRIVATPLETEASREDERTSGGEATPTTVVVLATPTPEPTDTLEPTPTPTVVRTRPPATKTPQPTPTLIEVTPAETDTPRPTPTLIEVTPAETDTPSAQTTGSPEPTEPSSSPTPAVESESVSDDGDEKADGTVSLAGADAQDSESQVQPVGGATLRPRVFALVVPWRDLLGLMLAGLALVALGWRRT